MSASLAPDECGLRCISCAGTGKVWPSVEGEIVDEYQSDSIFLDIGPIRVHGPGIYRVIVQKVGE